MATFYMLGAPINATAISNTYLSNYVTAVGAVSDRSGQLITIDNTDSGKSAECVLSFNRTGNIAKTFKSWNTTSPFDNGGYVNFALNSTPLEAHMTFYDFAPEGDTKPSTMGLGLNATQCPVFVIDLAKLYDRDTISDTNINKDISLRVRNKLGSRDPATLIDSGIIIPSTTQYLTEQQGEFATEYGHYQWGLSTAIPWNINGVEACGETFGVDLSATQTDCYAVMLNDLALYYWYVGVAPTTPAKVGFDVSQVPTGLNVSSQLDLAEQYSIDTITQKNSDIDFRIADGYEYTGDTQYSTNGADWYNVSGLYPDPEPNTDTTFNVFNYMKTYPINDDTTIMFRGFVKNKDTPTPTPPVTTNSVYEIDEQALYELKTFVISHLVSGELEYTDLSAYAVACYTMYGDLPATTPKMIYLGNQRTNIEAGLFEVETWHIDCGSIDLTTVDALTNDADVWLPFYGFKSVSNCVGHTVGVSYDMHLSNGEGMYIIDVDGVPVDSQQVKNGFELPLRITAANVQAQSSNPLDLAERRPFATVQAASAWVKGVSHDMVIVSGVPCTSIERDMMESLIKEGVIA